jgi:cAMP-dependent protein kinase regulator
MSKGEEPTFLRQYIHGDAFGELALLYNAPRAATITSSGDSTLYSLDRNTFNNIVKEASAKKRQKYESALKQVKILSSMENYEREKLADAVNDRHFKAGETIIKEGNMGDDFYMITEGKAKAYKIIEFQQIAVMDYKVGSYFGEIALLKNEPRAATVIAETDLTVIYLDRQMFKRLLGPLEEILKRNMASYSLFSD